MLAAMPAGPATSWLFFFFLKEKHKTAPTEKQVRSKETGSERPAYGQALLTGFPPAPTPFPGGLSQWHCGPVSRGLTPCDEASVSGSLAISKKAHAGWLARLSG